MSMHLSLLLHSNCSIIINEHAGCILV